MKEIIADILFAIILLLVGVAIGMYFAPNIVDGLWMKGYSEKEVKTIAYEKDSRGDWVCVNIKGMSYQRAKEICQHEVGHDIFHEKFAEMCENDWNKCIEVIE